MVMKSLTQSRLIPWMLVPVIAGLLCTTGPLPVTRAYAAAYPIQTPADAKTWGLDSLGNLMRSGQFNAGNNVKPLVLNPTLKVPLPFNLGDFVRDRQAP